MAAIGGQFMEFYGFFLYVQWVYSFSGYLMAKIQQSKAQIASLLAVATVFIGL